MAWEAAGAAQESLAVPVRVEREAEGRPGEGSLPLNKRRSPHPPWRWHAGAATGCLCKAHPSFASLGLVLDVGEGECLEDVLQAAQAQCRAPDVTSTQVAGGLDPARLVDLDPGRQVVGEAEPVGGTQLVEVSEHLWRRCVIVGHTRVKRQARATGNGLGGYPGKCCD